jgi:hypothetical protein
LLTPELELCVVVERDADSLRLLVEYQLRDAVLSGGFERVLEFPLCSGDGSPGDCAAILFFGKRSAQTRPEDYDDYVGVVRYGNIPRILKVVCRDKRFSLPQNCFDVNVVTELTIEASDDPFSEKTLRPHVRWR